jgi:hypothetical protein
LQHGRYERAKWAGLGLSLVVCTLAFLHVIPLIYGMAASCMIPLIWAIDAYRSEKRLMFVVAATLLLVTALPLLHLARQAQGF